MSDESDNCIHNFVEFKGYIVCDKCGYVDGHMFGIDFSTMKDHYPVYKKIRIQMPKLICEINENSIIADNIKFTTSERNVKLIKELVKMYDKEGVNDTYIYMNVLYAIIYIFSYMGVKEIILLMHKKMKKKRCEMKYIDFSISTQEKLHNYRVVYNPPYFPPPLNKCMELYNLCKYSRYMKRYMFLYIYDTNHDKLKEFLDLNKIHRPRTLGENIRNKEVVENYVEMCKEIGHYNLTSLDKIRNKNKKKRGGGGT